ncbi:chloroplast outer envelope protein [Monoraphidium neglectum]|uniref:Chloroplast outer envelope protein n=1 Tax=Monoraphidium neglectum TaxID=145388 RepID=A0A0D2JXX6_9CHLO|nr:chloroplast outer envelope protein [Monoraphidium neglectum]KIZ03478.1 chloroplast outer envelope protein [Monoraphidium neglectum]|eukprot:XP_013902497.1 chloroplast outer envelope protein [Monoraphidium neglectum]
MAAAQSDEFEEEVYDEDEDYGDEFEEELTGEEIEADGDEAIGGDLLGAAEGGSAAAAAAGGGGGDDEYEDEEEGAEEEEEEEEEEEDDLVVAQDWTGLRTLPEQAAVLDVLSHLRAAGARQLTVLLLGKSGVGKSSLVNALLGEKAAAVSAFKLQADTDSTVKYVRQVALGDEELDGYRLTLIDTCGLEDPEAGDTVSYGGRLFGA